MPVKLWWLCSEANPHRERLLVVSKLQFQQSNWKCKSILSIENNARPFPQNSRAEPFFSVNSENSCDMLKLVIIKNWILMSLQKREHWFVIKKCWNFCWTLFESKNLFDLLMNYSIFSTTVVSPMRDQQALNWKWKLFLDNHIVDVVVVIVGLLIGLVIRP